MSSRRLDISSLLCDPPPPPAVPEPVVLAPHLRKPPPPPAAPPLAAPPPAPTFLPTSPSAPRSILNPYPAPPRAFLGLDALVHAASQERRRISLSDPPPAPAPRPALPDVPPQLHTRNSDPGQSSADPPPPKKRRHSGPSPAPPAPPRRPGSAHLADAPRRASDSRPRPPLPNAEDAPPPKHKAPDDPHEWLLTHYAAGPRPSKSPVHKAPRTPTPEAAATALEQELAAVPTPAPPPDIDMDVDRAVSELVDQTLGSPAPDAMAVDVEDELLRLVDDPPPLRHPPSSSAAAYGLGPPPPAPAARKPSPLSRPPSGPAPTLPTPTLPTPTRPTPTPDRDRESMPPPATTSRAKESKAESSKKRKEPRPPAKSKAKKSKPGPRARAEAAAAAAAAAAAKTPNKASPMPAPPRKAAAARSRSASVMPGGSEADAKADDDGDADDDKLYCVCKTRYDEDRVMIACDRCDEWYHTQCVDMPELEVDLVDQFICPLCVAKSPELSLKTTYKRRCLNGLKHPDPESPKACHKPARGNFSKYCSDTCGVKYMQSRIDAWTKHGGKKEVLWESVQGAEKREGVVVRADAVLGLAVTGERASKTERETARLRALLAQVVRVREELLRGMEAVRWRERLVELAAARAESVGLCGWDQRLCFGDEECAEFGADVLESYAEGADNGEWWCPGPRMCDRHAGWQTVRGRDVVKERESKDEALLRLTTREREIRTRIEDLSDPGRVCEVPPPATTLANGNASNRVRPRGDAAAAAAKKGKKRKAV